jgi:TolB-like protein/Tfp pilus assembly protein PilF
MASLWGELKRRNVVRVALAYVIVSWLILQLVDVLIPLLALPGWVGRLIFLFLLVGFFLALFFAWAYELTPEGLKRESDVDGSDSTTKTTGRRLDFVIIGVLLAALAVFAVERFVLLPDRAPAIEAPAEIVATEVRQSIAVLPFDNLSNLSENAFFAAGMQEDILNSLAHIPELLVTSRTTTLRYIDSDLSLPEIAAELKVAYIIEGSVRRVDDEIRISVQLIEAANDKHVWSQSFDRTIQDVFAIQAEVAERVAEELQLKIVDKWRGQKPTDSVVAYDLFLRGRALASEVSTSSLERALNLYESAIEVDPGFADAYAGKATALALVGHYYPSQWQVQRDRAFSAAEKALELDPESAEANLGMGSILTAPAEARYGEAVPYLRRALAKNPNDTWTRWYLGIAYSFLELKDEFSVQIYEIYRRDPFSTRSNVAMALALGLESKPDETRMHLSRALQRDDIAPYWHWLAGRASWWAGDYHAAAHHLHNALELDPAYAWAHSELILVFMFLGDRKLLTDGFANPKPNLQPLVSNGGDCLGTRTKNGSMTMSPTQMPGSSGRRRTRPRDGRSPPRWLCEQKRVIDAATRRPGARSRRSHLRRSLLVFAEPTAISASPSGTSRP